MECLICVGEIKTVVEYQCKHKVCINCGIRLIFLYNNTNCPLCKQTSKKPVVKSLNLEEENNEEIEDDKVVYQNKQCLEEVKDILSLRCKVCKYKTQNKFELNKHYKTHALFLCNECFENKKEFWWEFKTYPISELKAHKKGKLEEEGFKGHVFCVHCNTFLYDEQAAVRHCNISHVQCTICDILGSKYKYYNTFKDLEQHYKNEHYCCHFKNCIENKCYAFPYKSELVQHLTRFHKENVKFTNVKKAGNCDVKVMDPFYKFNIEVQGRQKIKINTVDKNIRDYSVISSALRSSNELPDFLNRAIISKMNFNMNNRKAVVSRYTKDNKDELLRVIENTISKKISIDDCFDQVLELVNEEIALKLLKDINFEDIQSDVNKKYKDFKNNILFPKYKSLEPVTKSKREVKKPIGFKILEIKKLQNKKE